jgi:transcription initiation factor TFIIIB Brf1 subunit/transcription initiation factor TFIIB
MTDILFNIYSQIGPSCSIGNARDTSRAHTFQMEDLNMLDMSILDASSSFDTSNKTRNINGRSVDSSSFQRQAIRRKIPKCEECGLEMYKLSQEYICDGCGKVDPIVGGDVDIAERGGAEGVNDYNTSSNSAAPVRISGPGSYRYQRKLLSSTSNYKKQQKRNTVDQITNIVYQYDGAKPPPNVIKQAADLYYLVQQHCIKRGDVRKGTMAACVYRMCIKNGITRKPKEVADIFNIPQNELSNGEKILDKLFANGSLTGSLGTLTSQNSEITDNAAAKVNQFYFKEHEEMSSFLSRYFESLGVPELYMHFAQRLIRFTNKYRIAESSIMSSKCAGTIYILSIKVPELDIKRDDIEKACTISKSTFSRFYQAVFNMLESTDFRLRKVRSRLRNIFKRGKVPIV